MKGRPTKYNDEMLKKAKAYIEKCRAKNEFAMVEELAFELDVHRDTLYQWAEIHQDFSDTLRKILELQHIQLAKNGLNKGDEGYTPAITKLMLMNNHNYREKRDEDITSDGKPLTIILDK